MPKLRSLFRSLSLSLAAVTLFAACGDGDDTSNLSGSGADELRELALQLDVKTYRATYRVTVTDPANQTETFTYGVARKPPSSNTSYQATGVLGNAAAIVINDGTTVYNCTQEPNALPYCIPSAATAAASDNGIFSINQILAATDDTIEVTPADGRTVAGIESACFSVRAIDETTPGIGCFSRRDGIVTYLEAKDADGTRTVFELQTVENEVDDSLFTPPAGFEIRETAPSIPFVTPTAAP